MAKLNRAFRREVRKQHGQAAAAYKRNWPKSMKRKGSGARRELAGESRKTRRVFKARQALKLY